MITGVDEIRAALEGRNRHAAALESGHDGQGHGGLAGTALGGGYEKPVVHISILRRPSMPT